MSSRVSLENFTFSVDSEAPNFGWSWKVKMNFRFEDLIPDVSGVSDQDRWRGLQ